MIDFISKLETPDRTIYYPSYDNAATQHIIEKQKLNWDDDFENIDEIKNLKSDDVVIDVGAWIGDTTETFLKKGCIVHALEPREDNFLCLMLNCPDAHCYNLAAGNKGRYLTDLRGGNTGAYSLIESTDPARRGKVAVRLDDLFSTLHEIDFLKIDAEGYEVEILHGAAEILFSKHPTIHIEINPEALSKFGKTPEMLMDVLQGFGYKQYREVYRYYDQNWDIIAV